MQAITKETSTKNYAFLVIFNEPFPMFCLYRWNMCVSRSLVMGSIKNEYLCLMWIERQFCNSAISRSRKTFEVLC